MPVYAGLNVPDAGLLHFINSSDLAMYENTWSAALLGVSLFAKDFDVPNCPAETCRSVFLPGGTPNARLVGPHLNLTLYSVDTFKNSEVITIYNARGFVVMFEDLAPNSDSLVFDPAQDCVDGGQGIDNGVQLCVKQDGESIVVGKSTLPTSPSRLVFLTPHVHRMVVLSHRAVRPQGMQPPQLNLAQRPHNIGHPNVPPPSNSHDFLRQEEPVHPQRRNPRC